MDLKAIVREARGSKTQAQIAQELGVSPQAVSQWETGATIPSVDNLKRLGIEPLKIVLG